MRCRRWNEGRTRGRDAVILTLKARALSHLVLARPATECESPAIIPPSANQHAETGSCALYFWRQPTLFFWPPAWSGAQRRGLPIAPQCAAPASPLAGTAKPTRPGFRLAPIVAPSNSARISRSPVVPAIKPSATTASSPAITDATPWRRFRRRLPSKTRRLAPPGAAANSRFASASETATWPGSPACRATSRSCCPAAFPAKRTRARISCRQGRLHRSRDISGRWSPEVRRRSTPAAGDHCPSGCGERLLVCLDYRPGLAEVE